MRYLPALSAMTNWRLSITSWYSGLRHESAHITISGSSVQYAYGLAAFGASDFSTARELFAQATDIDERVLGRDHPATISARYNLGLLLRGLATSHQRFKPSKMLSRQQSNPWGLAIRRRQR